MRNQSKDDATWLPLTAERRFAANVRQEREARRLTQAALARQMTMRSVPLSQSAIAKLEREDDEQRRPISLIEAAALAAFFGRTLDEMITMPTHPLGLEWFAANIRRSNALAALSAARVELEEAEREATQAEAEFAALEGGR